MRPPWLSARAVWTNPNDYTETQALAALVKAKGLQWIGYESVRAPGERCAAVLDLDALNILTPETLLQTWHCKASHESVMLVNGSDCFVWRFLRAGIVGHDARIGGHNEMEYAVEDDSAAGRFRLG
ncbi:hypothetical protein HC248_00295 [Polaromonas vacuolata]|uniref:RES domain-containing protein n=1 Tax=Polaromonas vacuolata TaxID=37448 RepID=A0A6H2H576_9BURK|nr:hypothetical protein HC248_00295 [Polaromonas vacuolata]